MDTLVYIVSKLVGALVRPETWLVTGMALALLGLIFRRLRMAGFVLGLTFVATLLVAIFPIGELLLQPLEARYPTNPLLQKVDGIIVLGGGEDPAKSAFWGQPQLRESAERYTAALELARRFPQAQVLFAGGKGQLRDLAGGGVTEGSIAQEFFTAQGLAPERLLLEQESRNTSENATRSFTLAQPQPGQTWVLITSAFHMPRSMHAFTQAGWPELVAYPVDYRSGNFVDGTGWDLAENLRVLNTALKEYVGLLVYGGWSSD